MGMKLGTPKERTTGQIGSLIKSIETQGIKHSLKSLTPSSHQQSVVGRVDQPGMIATLASWRSRVQIPARPLEAGRSSDLSRCRGVKLAQALEGNAERFSASLAMQVSLCITSEDFLYSN